MSFNYRVFKEVELTGEQRDGTEVFEDVFSIRQVGYDDEGKPVNYTSEPYSPIGTTVEELETNILQMSYAISKPVLTDKDFEDGTTTSK